MVDREVLQQKIFSLGSRQRKHLRTPFCLTSHGALRFLAL